LNDVESSSLKSLNAVWEALFCTLCGGSSHIVGGCIARAGRNASTSETNEPTEDEESCREVVAGWW